jgi:hypothetical protein
MTLTPEDHRAIAVQVVALLQVAPRSQYTIEEFAPICGLTLDALRRRPAWKRYGGIKRGRRVVFPESARLAIAEGKR